METVIITGLENISLFLGLPRKLTGEMIRSGDIPAWRNNEKGAWRANPDTLREWAKKRHEKMAAINSQRVF